jgi:hypothetical protein
MVHQTRLEWIRLGTMKLDKIQSNFAKGRPDDAWFQHYKRHVNLTYDNKTSDLSLMIAFHTNDAASSAMHDS